MSYSMYDTSHEVLNNHSVHSTQLADVSLVKVLIATWGVCQIAVEIYKFLNGRPVYNKDHKTF